MPAAPDTPTTAGDLGYNNAAAFFGYQPGGRGLWPGTCTAATRCRSMSHDRHGAAGQRLGMAISVDRGLTPATRCRSSTTTRTTRAGSRSTPTPRWTRRLAVGAAAPIAFAGGLGSFVSGRRPPRAAGRVDRRRAFALSRLRSRDRRLRQRPGRLLAAAARPQPLLRRADLGPLPADRARPRPALRAHRTWCSAGDPAEIALGLVFVSVLLVVTSPTSSGGSSPTRSSSRGAAAGLAIIAATDPSAARARGRRRRRRRPALLARSPTRGGWAWAT